ncbi:hypothetical protein BGZ46_000605 [Entomortierella lignicola]|nr:hypothetical protein BGZ46_000605 [Entomortierella lignicola]
MSGFLFKDHRFSDSIQVIKATVELLDDIENIITKAGLDSVISNKMFCGVFPPLRSNLSPRKAADLAKVYLENARAAKDHDFKLRFCADAENALSQIKRLARKTLKPNINVKDKELCNEIANAYDEHCMILSECPGNAEKAEISRDKARKWRYVDDTNDKLDPSGEGSTDITQIPSKIFPNNVPRPVDRCKLPTLEQDVANTPQLAYCISLLSKDIPSETAPAEADRMLTSPDGSVNRTLNNTPDKILDTAFEKTLDGLMEKTADNTQLEIPEEMKDEERKWIDDKSNDTDEIKRLQSLSTKVIIEFMSDELKDPAAVAETIYLVPFLSKEHYQKLLNTFISGIDQSTLLDFSLLEGLAQQIQCARPDYLQADDLVKILSSLSARLQNTHQQSANHLYQLTIVVSRVLDAMADSDVKGLSREQLHAPLSAYLKGLKTTSDPYLVYQASYAHQALQYIPDDESKWKALIRRTKLVVGGVSGIATAVKCLDVNKLIDALDLIHGGLEEAYNAAMVIYEDVAPLIESGQGFLDSLREGLTFDRVRPWYTTLRSANILLRNGQLADFETLVRRVRCRRDPAFQWGVCQILGDIAANAVWGDSTCERAIDFLVELYKNDKDWGQHTSVKRCILTTLLQLSKYPHGDIKDYSYKQLLHLRTYGSEDRQALYGNCINGTLCSYPLRVSMPPVGSPSLFDRVQGLVGLDDDLLDLKRQRLPYRNDVVYIPPQAKASVLSADSNSFSLMDKVEKFIRGEDLKVFLLLGDSGAGKSTFNRELERKLWDDHKDNYDPIPLFINLPAFDRPDQDLVTKYFRRNNFTEPQIRAIKRKYKFILICDGYDESQQTKNIYDTNQLNQPDQWNAKMVISCRTEFLGKDYKDRFLPMDEKKKTMPQHFQEAVIAPFSDTQIQEYIKDYVLRKSPLWKPHEYIDALNSVPNLKDLVKNPFLLTLTLEVLPRMMDPGQDHSREKVTRVVLYDHFIEQWLERGKKRVGSNDLSPQKKAALDGLVDDGFTQNGINFLKKLASAIYREQEGQPVVEYKRFVDEVTWKREFFNHDDEIQILREASPLIRNGNQYRFIHRSLLEYCFSCSVFDPRESTIQRQVHSSERRGSNSSIYSFKEQFVSRVKQASTNQQSSENPLNWRSFVNEQSLLQFLVERVQQGSHFKERLLAMVEQSKADREIRIAAANAMTILVRAGVQFNGADLRNIKIPGADLSYGVFDSAQLEGADLRTTNLRNIWLREANLDGAQMSGVQFGELPMLQEDSIVKCCIYSPDGKKLAVGLMDGNINLYETSSWSRMHTLRGHSGEVNSISFSPNGDRIASGGYDWTVRLWDVNTGECIHTLEGHSCISGAIWSVVYSPIGDQIASGSSDGTVRLWNVNTGECIYILHADSYTVYCVVYSPNGDQIASGGFDSTVNLWDVNTGECTHILQGHSNQVNCIVYSPHRDRIASGSEDYTVRLWDVNTGECIHTLQGHCGRVQSIVYSPDGDRIASGSWDVTVRLWDVYTGECIYTLHGHSDYITSVVYSPNGDRIASGSRDETVRLWDVNTGECVHALQGHSGYVYCVMYSPNGDRIASGSDDHTVRLWDVNTGECGHALHGHSGNVGSVAYPPNGDRIASGSDDNTVRLWDVNTGECVHVFQAQVGYVIKIVHSPNGDQIASGGGGTTVCLWDANTGECIHTLDGHSSSVCSVMYSPNGDRVASGSYDNTARLWDVNTGECIHTLEDHSGRVISVVYSPNGDRIASGSYDSTVRLWDVNTGECVHTLRGHVSAVEIVVYSPNGDQIASGSEDWTVRLWDVNTGECIHTLQGHSYPVDCVVYSPDGDRIASGSGDWTVRLWDVSTGECIHILGGHSDVIWSVAYSLNGDQIASGSKDNTVRLWDVNTGECLATILNLSKNSLSFDFASNFDALRVVIGGGDGSVRLWRIIKEADEYKPILGWSSPHSVLIVTNVSFKDVQNLSSLNQKLLIQRGARNPSIETPAQ